MTSQFSVLLKKYSVPFLLFVVGIIMLIFGLRNNQDAVFVISAIMMFAAGAISILYSSGKFKPMLAYLIGVVAGSAAIVVLAISWVSVAETQQYEQDYEECRSLAKQNLEDVRYIQKAYVEQYGVYLSDWDALIDFAKNGTIPYVDSKGSVPDRRITPEENKYLYTGNPAIDNKMTEDEAYRLSKWKEGPNWQEEFSDFKRDTIPKSLLESKFQSRSYREARTKMGFYAFSADSLPFIPFSKGLEKWNFEAIDSINVNDVTYPALYVSGKIPFARIKGKDNDTEEMYFGSLTTNDLAGSWEND